MNLNHSVNSVTNTPERTEKKTYWKPIGDDQYQIDAGQKRFGASECGQCGLVYQLGDPEDEIRHEQFHSQILPHAVCPVERLHDHFVVREISFSLCVRRDGKTSALLPK